MGPNNRCVMSIVRVTEENCELLAGLTAEEANVSIAVMRMFFQLMIGREFTDDELTEEINTFISSLDDELRACESVEMSIDDEGDIFYYSKENPDDMFYPN